MGRGVRRMPFRKALKRDDWEPSREAKAVKEQWNLIRKGGGKPPSLKTLTRFQFPKVECDLFIMLVHLG